MSQQPPMSSFSALEFHAGHHKGAASRSWLPRETVWLLSARCHFGEPLHNVRRTLLRVGDTLSKPSTDSTGSSLVSFGLRNSDRGREKEEGIL